MKGVYWATGQPTICEPPLGVIPGREQALFETKEQGSSRRILVKKQGADKCNPGARSTKNGKKEHGAVENVKKEHGARGKTKKEQGAQKNEKGAGKKQKRRKAQKIERSREQEGKL